MSVIPEDMSGPVTSSTRPKRGWAFGLGVFAALAAAGVAAGLIVSQFGASGGTSLQAIPDDVDVLVRFDFQEYTDNERVDRLVSAFSGPLAAAGHIDSADVDLLQLIDEELQSELGVTIEEDISPWIGEDLSVGMWFDPPIGSEPSFLVSIGVGDRAAAEQFVEKLLDQASVEITRSDHDGGTLFAALDNSSDDGVVWLGDDMMLISTELAPIDSAIETMREESIVDDPDYLRVTDELPETPLVEFYMSDSLVEKMATGAGMIGGADAELIDMLETIGSTGATISLNDEGIQFDAIQVNDGDNEWFQALAFDGSGLVTGLPRSTLGFLGFTFPGDLITDLMGVDVDDGTIEEAEDFFSQTFGVDLVGELLPALGPNILLAAVQSSEGMLASELDVPIGVIFAMDISDRGPIEKVLAGLEEFAAEEGVTFSGENPRVILVDGQPAAAYALTDSSLSIATSGDLLGSFLDGSGDIGENPTYRRLDDALVGSGLTVYFDIAAILDEIPMPADERAIFGPLQGFGSAIDIGDGLVRGSALLLVDY